MPSIEDLESKLKRLMRSAVERWDNREISRLNELAESLSRSKVGRDLVERALSPVSTKAEAAKGARKAFELQVSFGDIRQSFLRVAELRRAGFDLPPGREMTIEALTPSGTMRFRTSIGDLPRLRARREVAAFYKAVDARPGDKILFEEIGPNAYRISKVPIDRRKAEPLDLEFLTALEETLSEWNSENDDQAYRDL